VKLLAIAFIVAGSLTFLYALPHLDGAPRELLPMIPFVLKWYSLPIALLLVGITLWNRSVKPPRL
jgi:hypothetical protein